MSKQDWKEIQVIGDLRKVLNDAKDMLGINIVAQIPSDKAELFEELQKKYDDFYDMSIKERLIYSGYMSAKKVNVKGDNK